MMLQWIFGLNGRSRTIRFYNFERINVNPGQTRTSTRSTKARRRRAHFSDAATGQAATSRTELLLTRRPAATALIASIAGRLADRFIPASVAGSANWGSKADSPWGSAIPTGLIRDSVEWTVWAGPAGSEGAPVEGRGARRDNRLFLDGPAGVCYCFSELTARPARRFMGPGWRLRFERNENGVKPLKTNKSAKWPISHPQ